MSQHERPILFSGDMVRAILRGHKTQTRRPVKRLSTARADGRAPSLQPAARCPYGRIGDLLWVRETWALVDDSGDARGMPNACVYRADEHAATTHGGRRWRPSIHMPRWAARIDLVIREVRREPLQALTAQDALAEGIAWVSGASQPEGARPTPSQEHINRFARCWDDLYAGRGYGWAANPMVWVIAFRMMPADRAD